MKNSMTPLIRIFDDHHLCDSTWCYKKRLEEDDTLAVDEKSNRMKVGYYMINNGDKELYAKLCKKY